MFGRKKKQQKNLLRKQQQRKQLKKLNSLQNAKNHSTPLVGCFFCADALFIKIILNSTFHFSHLNEVLSTQKKAIENNSIVFFYI